MVNFTNDHSQPFTADDVRDKLVTGADSVDALYKATTGGAIRFTGRTSTSGDVYGWYTLPYASTSCNQDAWRAAAVSAAAADGFSAADYQHVIIMFPHTTACPWGGIGMVNAAYSWVNEDSLSVGTIAHELGHNLGLAHANRLVCTGPGGAPTILSTSCTEVDYGDPYDFMGGGDSRHGLNAYDRLRLNAKDGPRVLDVTASGTYHLADLDDTATTGRATLLRVTRAPDSPTRRDLYIELRQQGGPFDTFTGSLAQGVTLRLATIPGSYAYQSSELLDMHPDTSTVDDAALLPGETYTDIPAGLTVSIDSVATDDATVTVTLAPDAGTPSVPVPAVATTTNTSATITWPAASDDVGVTDYSVYKNGVLAGHTDGATTYTQTGLAAGSSADYTVVAIDRAGHHSAQSAAVTAQTQHDTSPPTAVANAWVSARTPDGSGTHLELHWAPSSDNVAVASYDIYRSTMAGSKTWRANVAAPATTWTDTNLGDDNAVYYWIVAIDSAGLQTQPARPLFAKALPSSDCAPDLWVTSLTTTDATLAWSPPPCSQPGDAVTSTVSDRDPVYTTIGTTSATTYDVPTSLVSSATFDEYTVNLQWGASGYVNTGRAPVRATADVADPTSTPGPPRTVGYTPFDGAITLTWSAPATGTAVEYVVMRDGLSVGFTTDTRWVDTSTADATGHTWTVRAMGANLTVSGEAQAADAPDTQAPTSPSDLHVVSQQDGLAVLAWHGSTDDFGVAGYRVYRDGSLIATLGADTLELSDVLAASANADYRVSALDAAGNESPLSDAVHVVGDVTAPAAPQGLAVVQTGAHAAHASWTAASDDVGVTGYELSVDGAPVAASATSADLTGLAEGPHAVTVLALDAAGNRSAASGPATVQIDTTPPTAPANLRIESSAVGSAILAWDASTDAVGVAGYELYRDGVPYASLAANVMRYTDTFDASAHPRYEVAARDAQGNVSALSAAVTVPVVVVPPPLLPPPPGPSVTAPPAPVANAPLVARWAATTGTAQRGLSSTLDCSTACTVVATVTVDARTARQLGLRGSRTVGTGRLAVARAGSLTVTATISKQVRSRLAKLRGVRVTETFAVTDAAGHVTVVTKVVTLR